MIPMLEELCVHYDDKNNEQYYKIVLELMQLFKSVGANRPYNICEKIS